MADSSNSKYGPFRIQGLTSRFVLTQEVKTDSYDPRRDSTSGTSVGRVRRHYGTYRNMSMIQYRIAQINASRR